MAIAGPDHPPSDRPIGSLDNGRGDEAASSEVQSFLARIRAGDETAISQFLSAYEDRLSRLVEGKINREHDQGLAHDVNARSIVRSRLGEFVVHLRSGRYLSVSSFQHLWNMLALIVSRRTKDMIRDTRHEYKGRHREPFYGYSGSSDGPQLGAVDRVPDPKSLEPDTLVKMEYQRALVIALEGNPNVRRTFELLLEGKEKAEIAQILGRSKSSVDLYCRDIIDTANKIKDRFI